MNLLSVILLPLSILYAIVVYLRNQCYNCGLFSSHSFDTPSICVGNISLGGTGKTPMIDLLVNHYSDKKIVVLSRGYGRSTKGLIHADVNSTAEQIGDEPKQLLSAHPQINVVVCSSRVEGMEYIEEYLKPDLVLLDDAFQHRSIKAKVNLLLTTYSKPYFKDFYLPSGTLRDHKISVRRADLLIVTKAPEKVSENEQLEFKSKFVNNRGVYFSSLAYAKEVIGESDRIPLNELKNKRVHLVTGIANPKPLLAFLNQEGIQVKHFKFKDHQNYSSKDIAQFSEKADLILTTEKDYVKLKGSCESLYHLGVNHRFHQENSFFNDLDRLLWS